ncbi:MAG: PhnD/SsuA/transferrin family substrate-binding protein [Lysobacterales bacterium]|nr:PhnD/SsuA/transferrin family substrate-binding protein [Xanthomonadales bacterium]MCB1610264.1 PhnD/SsuA/transferrin family substrate-binding protein [Xanthomonadales bacterium]
MMIKNQGKGPVHAIALGLTLMGLTAVDALSAAEYNFAVEPTYTPERAREVYEPLVDYLSKATGEQFKLVVARNYAFYWNDMRNRKDLHFVFDEAHFTDFRIQRFGYEPLAKSSIPTSYSLLSQDDVGEGNVQAFVARRLVTMPAPNLGFALMLEYFPNPMQQPDLRSLATSWRDTVEIVFAGEADAALVPSWLRDLYPNLIPIVTTREFPGPAVSASADVPDDLKAKVKEALLVLHEDAALYEVLSEIGMQQFVEASKEEYKGSEQMLKNFYGYKQR